MPAEIEDLCFMHVPVRSQAVSRSFCVILVMPVARLIDLDSKLASSCGLPTVALSVIVTFREQN